MQLLLLRDLGREMAEVEETLKRIQAHKGVIGIIIVNAEGIPIRTTLDNSTTVQYAGLLHQLTMKAKSTVRDVDPQNDLTFLRIRSKKHEIMVAPDKEYLFIVIQNPCPIVATWPPVLESLKTLYSGVSGGIGGG
ncbi:UNVERIFIED_CONTAM: Dynein light chain roadblock-type 2 [Gekko kuhli]